MPHYPPPPLGPRLPVGIDNLGPMPAPPGALQRVNGRPFTPLPGAVNARQAERARTPVAPTIPPPPQIDPNTKCLIDYLCACVVGKLTDELRWTPQTARGPAHVQVPFAGQKFHRHVGTGVTTDPPVVLLPGGGFVVVADFQVPDLHRGVVNFWGIDVDPVAALPEVDVQFLKSGRPLDIYGSGYGSQVSASAGFWEGPPFGITTPNRDICEHLTRRQTFQMLVRNNSPGNVNIAAVFGGHIYPPTRDSGENSIYGTFVDNPERY